MISIIIPLYNKSKTIERAIESVINQTFEDWELIVIDDGSTDDSKSIVNNYADNRIKYFFQQNSGVSVARNNGIDRANGEWLVFLDADDYLMPDALEIFTGLHADFGTDLCAANYQSLKDGIYKTASNRERGLIKNNFKSWYYHEYYPGRMASFMIKRSLMLDNKFCPDLTRFEDCEAMVRVLRKCKVSFSDKVSMVYTDDQKGLSNRADDPMTDYAFHLQFSTASFWERMYLVSILSNAFRRYPESRWTLIYKYFIYFPYILLKIIKLL